jgi:flagellar motor component MotA
MTGIKFEEECRAFITKAMAVCEKSRREGLASLVDEPDVKDMINERDVFYYGIALAADGLDRSLLEKILNNIVNQEGDDEKRRFKTMQKEAVMSIKNGDNPRLMLAVLLSLVPPSKLTAGPAPRHAAYGDEEESDWDEFDLED